MKNLVRLFAAAAIALSVAGCAVTDKVESVYSAVTAVEVSPQAVVYAVSAFQVVEVSATNYLRLRRCDGSNGPVCRDPARRVQIISAIQQGRAARDTLKAFVRTHPGELGPRGVYDALVQATDVLRSIIPAAAQ